ncbi:hypothetical protein QQZ08_003541 [Neonectria magnoliae]|uniref:NB-ARC domain-containing protein n=1 Tax=Neonectria magnoliae TaxID=2732573 RepID=A0ABR1IA62_9HYPO
MGSISKDHWDVALHRCRSRLTEDECRRIEGVASFDTLRDAIDHLKEKYTQGLFYRCLRRLEPFLANVQSLAGAVDVLAQAKPEIMSLLWRTLRLALELVVRHADAMEQMTSALEAIGKSLPRFEFYQDLFPNSCRISERLAELVKMIVDFGVDTIKLFKKHPLRVILTSLWANYEDKYKRAVQRIEAQSKLIDMESHAAKMELDETRHEEIKRLVENLNTGSPESVAATQSRAPYHVLPMSQDPKFFEQNDDAVTACHKALDPGPKPSGLRTFTLHGIGGVGKTATAIQYAHKFKGTYLTVIWVPAESPSRLLQALNQAARDLGAVTEQNKPEEAREALINRLQQDDQPRLLVFDNVEDASVLNGC